MRTDAGLNALPAAQLMELKHTHILSIDLHNNLDLLTLNSTHLHNKMLTSSFFTFKRTVTIV